MKGLSVIIAAFILVFGTAASRAGTAHRSRHATMHAHNIHMMHDRNTNRMHDNMMHDNMMHGNMMHGNMMHGTNMDRGMTTVHDGGFSGLQSGVHSMGQMGGGHR
jgi:hypothetical protein